MSADPFAQPIDWPTLHTGHEVGPDCTGICDQGPLPGESRVEHVARLKARHVLDPLVVDIRPTRRSAVVLVACPSCTKSMPAGGRCIGCYQHERAARVAVAPAPMPGEESSLLVDCDRCGQPKWLARACEACRLGTRARRASA